MMKRKITLWISLLVLQAAWMNAQTFTRVGNANDVNTNHQQGFLLMGGSSDNFDALQWFYSLTNVGDVVVIRAGTGTGYNSDFTAFPGLMNSITTIESINTVARANNPAVETAIRNAEAVFITGGNQADYYNFWRNTRLTDALLYLIHEKGGAVGGTSAGLAMLGEVVYAALGSSITSAQALANPYNSNVTLRTDFLVPPISILQNVVTDSHYNNPDRRGRHMVFLARMNKDWGMQARGIGVNEVTAVAIESNGIARIFGEFPAYQDFAYFLTMHPDAEGPETCVSGTPLTWNRGGQALKVYKVAGTFNGANTFDLNTWQTGTGGTWECWSVLNGTLNTTTSCSAPAFGFNYYNLTLQSNPAGANPIGAGSYVEGTKVTVTAGSSCYPFLYWTKDGAIVSTSNTFSYTMPAGHTTLVANFDENVNGMVPPYSENFNAAASLPGCWQVTRPVGTTDWAITRGQLSGAGLSAFANGNANNNPKEMNLISPPFNFTNYHTINLRFEHRYRHQANHSANIAYSIDGGNTWTILQSYSSNSANPAVFNQTIAALTGQPDVRFRWQFLQTANSTASNRNWTVDNIRITGIPQQHTLAINVIGNGVVKVNGADYVEPMVIDYGTFVELEAVAEEGWLFSSWDGDLTGNTSPEMLLINNNKEVTALFIQINAIPFSGWALYLGVGLILLFLVYRFRNSIF